MSRRRINLTAAPAPATQSAPATQRRVRLLATHTHAGVEYEADAAITVSDASARWLIDRGIAIAVFETTEE